MALPRYESAKLMSDIPEDIKRAVSLGADAEGFLNSTMGRYLTERAQQLTFEGLNALRDVNPEDPKAVRAAQNKVVIGEAFIEFIKDAIDNGRIAAETFINREHQD